MAQIKIDDYDNIIYLLVELLSTISSELRFKIKIKVKL